MKIQKCDIQLIIQHLSSEDPINLIGFDANGAQQVAFEI